MEVVRSRAFSSNQAISSDEEVSEQKPVRAQKKQKRADDEDEDERPDVLKSLMDTVAARTASREKADAEKLKYEHEALELAWKKEECEARVAEEHWQHEKETKDREEERRKDAAKSEAWDRAMRMIESKNPIMQAMGEKLAKELAKEEGILID